MSLRLVSSVIVLMIITAVSSCKRADTGLAFEGFESPSHFPNPKYDFSNNEVTKEGFELGRKLFYDPILSRNNTISCGSCHIPTAAFTHHGHDVSHGIDDLLGTRNTPALHNLAWSTFFHWDGGIFNLDLQAIAPITNPVEMDQAIDLLPEKLKNTKEYPELFKKAFGDAEITNQRMLKALSQFMVMCISANSKYDSVITGNAHFTTMEEKGYQLFKTNCSSCHQEPLFTDGSFRNNGLIPSNVNDKGKYEVTLSTIDLYKFKVPSLRNLSYTKPYMHDGRFLNLTAVLNHYDSHLSNEHHTLDPSLESETEAIPLTEDEKKAIISFLKTLDDPSFIRNKLLSEQ